MDSSSINGSSHSVLYAPYRYGPIPDALIWNLDIIAVLVFSVALLWILVRRSRSLKDRNTVLAVTTFLTLLSLAFGVTLVRNAESRTRRLWNQRLFMLAQGYAAAVEKMGLDTLPLDHTAETSDVYRNAFEVFEQWQTKDRMVVNICVFRINPDGEFVYLIRPAADYDEDGRIDGALEEQAVPGKTLLPETVRTDPLRLKQILVNLLGNAVKFTEKGIVEIMLEWKMDDVPKPWHNRTESLTLPCPCEGCL